MPVMLVVDPTEAVHSELIVDTFERYFTTGQYTALGGAIAYPLLTHNTRMFAADDEEERSLWIERILQADDRFLAQHPESTLVRLLRRHAEQIGAGGHRSGWRRGRRRRPNARGWRGRSAAVSTTTALHSRPCWSSSTNSAPPMGSCWRGPRISSPSCRQCSPGTCTARARRLAASKWVRAVRRDRTVAGAERRVGHAGEPEQPGRAGDEDDDRGALSTALIALEDARREQERMTGRVEVSESEVAALRADRL